VIFPNHYYIHGYTHAFVLLQRRRRRTSRGFVDQISIGPNNALLHNCCLYTLFNRKQCCTLAARETAVPLTQLFLTTISTSKNRYIIIEYIYDPWMLRNTGRRRCLCNQNISLISFFRNYIYF